MTSAKPSSVGDPVTRCGVCQVSIMDTRDVPPDCPTGQLQVMLLNTFATGRTLVSQFTCGHAVHTRCYLEMAYSHNPDPPGRCHQCNKVPTRFPKALLGMTVHKGILALATPKETITIRSPWISNSWKHVRHLTSIAVNDLPMNSLEDDLYKQVISILAQDRSAIWSASIEGPHQTAGTDPRTPDHLWTTTVQSSQMSQMWWPLHDKLAVHRGVAVPEHAEERPPPRCIQMTMLPWDMEWGQCIQKESYECAIIDGSSSLGRRMSDAVEGLVPGDDSGDDAGDDSGSDSGDSPSDDSSDDSSDGSDDASDDGSDDGSGDDSGDGSDDGSDDSSGGDSGDDSGDESGHDSGNDSGNGSGDNDSGDNDSTGNDSTSDESNIGDESNDDESEDAKSEDAKSTGDNSSIDDFDDPGQQNNNDPSTTTVPDDSVSLYQTPVLTAGKGDLTPHDRNENRKSTYDHLIRLQPPAVPTGCAFGGNAHCPSFKCCLFYGRLSPFVHARYHHARYTPGLHEMLGEIGIIQRVMTENVVWLQATYLPTGPDDRMSVNSLAAARYDKRVKSDLRKRLLTIAHTLSHVTDFSTKALCFGPKMEVAMFTFRKKSGNRLAVTVSAMVVVSPPIIFHKRAMPGLKRRLRAHLPAQLTESVYDYMGSDAPGYILSVPIADHVSIEPPCLERD